LHPRSKNADKGTERARHRRVAAWLLAAGTSMAACGESSSPLTPGDTAPISGPSITAHPQSQTITAGEKATLTVSAAGGGTLTYQWFQGSAGVTSAPIAGATTTSFTTPALSATSSYWARVSNVAGSVDSSAAIVTVTSTPAPPAPPSAVVPSITSQPASQSVASGQSATLNVGAAGTEPLVFQWYSGASGNTSSPVPGATSSSFTTPPLVSTASYWVRVSNGAGSIDSVTVTVTVTAPPPSSGSSLLEDQVLALVNERRASGATCGGTFYPTVAPLTVDPHLRAAARDHSQDMATNNYFSHTSQDGRTFDQRIWQSGYTGGFPLGENIAAGASSAQAVVDGWMSSSGHCRNIMNGSFRVIGIGYAFNQSSSYRHYWTQSFGGG
jgi:uncharacterized protein YkwD